MAITYTPTTNFGAKDSLPTNDPDKVIKGSEFTTEFTALQTAFSLAAPAASPTFTGTVTIASVDINGGTIDGVTIGGSSAGAITGTTGQFNTSLNVDGSVTADGLTVDGSGLIQSSTGGVLTLKSTDTAASTSSVLGQINFYNSDSSGSSPNNAVIIKSTGQSGGGNGDLEFKVTNSGIEGNDALTSLRIDDAGDISFYEDTGTTPKFFWDASAESLGIGTTSPDTQLHVYASSGDAEHRIEAVGSGNDTILSLKNLNTGAGAEGHIRFMDGSVTSGLISYLHNAGGVSDAMTFSTAGSERMRIDSSGNVGIGTSSPDTLMELRAANPVLTIRDTETSTASNDARLRLAETGVSDALGNYYDIGYIQGALQFRYNTSEYMRLDDSGNVGIGTTDTGNAVLSVSKTSAAHVYSRINGSNTSFEAGLQFADQNTLKWTVYKPGNSDNLAFFNHTGASTAMTLDSDGRLLVGGTNTNPAGNNVDGIALGSNGRISAQVSGNHHRLGRGEDGTIVAFHSAGGEEGSISISGSTTSYNTSSDYRLKDVDGPITNSGAYIDALKPVQGSWKADGSRFIGLIAHEVQEVSETPIATGEKDGEEMQGMDYSAPELIANLIAEIQSLRARVAQLEGV